MSEIIICKRCGQRIEVDDRFDVQYCSCGVYYRRKRGFEKGWTLAGWWKGDKKKKKGDRQ